MKRPLSATGAPRRRAREPYTQVPEDRLPASSFLRLSVADARWRDLALPRRSLSQLRVLAAQTREISGKQGTTALFAGGAPETRLLAARLVARALSADLYRIDTDRIIDRYIGETEKNLSRAIAAAEAGAAAKAGATAEAGHGILLFDEADALFGKRTDMKDSHNRYANLEVSHLLDRLEAFHGLAILTTNQEPTPGPDLLKKFTPIVKFTLPRKIRPGSRAPGRSRRSR
jgi:hypothetical protein